MTHFTKLWKGPLKTLITNAVIEYAGRKSSRRSIKIDYWSIQYTFFCKRKYSYKMMYLFWIRIIIFVHSKHLIQHIISKRQQKTWWISLFSWCVDSSTVAWTYISSSKCISHHTDFPRYFFVVYLIPSCPTLQYKMIWMKIYKGIAGNLLK